MATWTKEEMRNRVLEHIDVKAAGQSASAEDAKVTDDAIESAWSMLRKLGLAPSDKDTIPDWAQVPFRDYVAVIIKPSFGIAVPRLPNGDSPEMKSAERELARQVAGSKAPIQIRTDYY